MSMSSRAACHVLVMLGCLFASLPVMAVEIMHWERDPLPIALPVGTERVIVLDRNVRIGLPTAIADSRTLRVQSAGGALYLLASEPFDTQRVRLQDVETNQVVLVDLKAVAEASDERIRLVIPPPGDNAGHGRGKGDNPGEEPAPESTTGTPVPVILTRYAAQSLYAPQRTIEALSGVSRVAMRLPATLPSLLPALPVEATPVAAWQLDGWTVTAVRLVNRDPVRAFELDPRWLQGELHSVVFMHPTLGPRGSAADTTTAFIVTHGLSLAQALPLSRDAQRDDGKAEGGGA